MIDVRELRIGNYLQWEDPSNDIVVVRGISLSEPDEQDFTSDNFFVQYKETNREEYGSAMLGEFIPIPLTEERLLNFGFVNVDDEIDFSEFVLGDFRIFGNGSDKQEPFYFAYDYNGKEIRVELLYVHQLQNLFHSLNQGQELTLKETAG